MTDYTDDYSGRTQYYLRLSVTGGAGSQSWTLDAVSKSGYGSYATDAFPWSVKIGSQSFSGSHSLDFRPDSSGKTIRLGSGSASGSGTLSVSASHGPASVFGTASLSGSYSAGAALGAPGTPKISQQTTKGGRFDWTAASGSPAEYGFYISEYPDFRSHVFSQWLGLVLTYTWTGGKPGKTYYARTRATKSGQPGPYSGTLTFKTLSGALVSDGSTWKPAEVLVSDGAVWKPAEMLVSDGAAWKPAGG